jgi:hypothetical protein
MIASWGGLDDQRRDDIDVRPPLRQRRHPGIAVAAAIPRTKAIRPILQLLACATAEALASSTGAMTASRGT